MFVLICRKRTRGVVVERFMCVSMLHTDLEMRLRLKYSFVGSFFDVLQHLTS